MKKYIVTTWFCLMCLYALQSQNTGIGTTDPQATLDVNGTFRLGQGAIVNGISADSMMVPGSDSLLPTQLAIMRYLENGKWVQNEGEVDSVYLLTSQTEPLPYIKKVVEQNGMAYVLTYYGLWIFDVSDPDTIIQRDSIGALFETNNFGYDCDLEVQGDFAYICTYGTGKFGVFDISNPDSIILRSSNEQLYAFRSLVVDGQFAYVLSYNWSQTVLVIYDIADPDTLVTRKIFDIFFYWNNINGITMIEKTGKWLWLVTPQSNLYPGSSEIYNFDVSDPDTLVRHLSVFPDGHTFSTTTSGNRFYYAQYHRSGSFLCTYQVNQNSNLMIQGGKLAIPTPRYMHAKGNELFLSVDGPYNNTGNYASIINFDISAILPRPTWVFESTVNFLHTIGHFRLIGADSRLKSIKLFPQQDKRDLTQHVDGSMRYTISPWYTDSLFNVTMNNGYVGIGTDSPAVKLHVKGDQRIEGNYFIEFGADIEGKGADAGKIGYGLMSDSALDIIGGGPPEHRRIDFHGEDGIEMTGKLNVADTVTHLGAVIAANGLHITDRLGIGAPPTEDQTLLVHDGIQISEHGSTPGGILINRPGNVFAEANFIGDRGDQVAGIHTSSGWNLLQSATGNIGIGMEPGDDKLSIAGSCKTNLMYVNGSALFENGVRFSGNNQIYLGLIANFTSSIKYQTNSLDFIINTNGYNNTIRLKAEGGTTIDGPIHVADTLTATSITTSGWTELGTGLQNGWVNYGNGFVTIAMHKDPMGVVHLRGLITGGSNQQNTVIVNLPPGFRPIQGHQLYAVPNGVNTAGRIDVESDGDVVFRGSTNTFISMDPISFKTN